MGHQGSKFSDSAERTAFFKWNDHFEHEFLGIPRPNINVILHVPAEVSMLLIAKRGNAMDGHENIEHLRRAEATYLELARTFPNFVLVECMKDGAPPTLDGLRTKDEIHELIWERVRHLCPA